MDANSILKLITEKKDTPKGRRDIEEFLNMNLTSSEIIRVAQSNGVTLNEDEANALLQSFNNLKGGKNA
jgi:hypothetical protein